MLEHTNKIPELGDVVKVYYRQKKTFFGGYTPNHEFGIIVKIIPEGKLRLKHSYQEYGLAEVDWFLESSKVYFVE